MSDDTGPAGDASRTEEFQELRPLLFSIAYRILGSVDEAEDTVQDAWLRYQEVTDRPVSPKSYLSAVVTRLAIDTLRSARVRRERYVGAWLPEPLLDDPYQDPSRAAELADSLSTAALLLLERLSPLERAVFVLRDVFGFGYGEVADAVGRSEAACRQLANRARQHMAAGRPRFEADRAKRQELAERFFAALHAGDVERLQALLSADAQLVGDGGGNAPQWAHAISGASNVARLLVAMVPEVLAAGIRLELTAINGQSGAIFRDRNDQVFAAWTLDVADGQVQAIHSVINPDKLDHLGPTADPYLISDVRHTRRRSR